MSQVSLDELSTQLASLTRQRLQVISRQVLTAAAVDLRAKAAANIQARLRERSRSLLTSLRFEIAGDGLSAEVLAGGSFQGLSVPYARIQEYGGVVLPVKGRYLAIPVGPALNANGVAKYRSARQAPHLVFVQSRKGQPLLVRVYKGTKGQPPPPPEVWYILRRSVRLPERRYLRDAWSEVVATLPQRVADAAAGAMAA